VRLRTTPGGWFYTGDIGRIDSQGRYFIVDRRKDPRHLWLDDQLLEGSRGKILKREIVAPAEVRS
jgi:acyl-CoA synthetase (AMP-forming)/AMP-acid ligase II